MAESDDERFVKVELPNALRAIYARAITKPSLATKIVFDHFRDADRESSHADILKALAFCFKLVNTNAHDDPAAARRILGELERMR
jgi:thermostable 8-oxoguanine DNA glycosylase